MFEMTTLEKVYKYCYEENLNLDDMSKDDLSLLLERFDASEFETDPVQSLAKNNNVYLEDMFIKAKSDIAVVRRPRYRPHHRMHKHDFIEFTYVYNGLCKFLGPNGDETILKVGDLLLLATDTDHQLHIDSDESIIFHIAIRKSTFDKVFVILLDNDDILSQFFSRVIYGSSPASYILFEVGSDEKIKTVFLEMYREMHLELRTSKCMINVYFEWLCVYLMRNYKCKVWIKNPQSGYVDMMNILIYLRDNYNNTSLDETAQKFNYSKSYLWKIIKKYTGQTYGKLIRDIRMQKACELIKKNKISIANISSILGYEDTSSFYRSFKNTYKLTPTQYKLKNKDI